MPRLKTTDTQTRVTLSVTTGALCNMAATINMNKEHMK